MHGELLRNTLPRKELARFLGWFGRTWFGNTEGSPLSGQPQHTPLVEKLVKHIIQL